MAGQLLQEQRPREQVSLNIGILMNYSIPSKYHPPFSSDIYNLASYFIKG
jgi:hypothetical protein